MIVLNTDSENTIVMSLTCRQSLTSPYYLFHFTNEFDPGNEVYFNCTDQNLFNERNVFLIIETGSTAVTGTALNNGIINLTPTQTWRYNIYEASAQTLSVSATTGILLSSGKVVVLGQSSNLTDDIYL